MRYKYFDNNKVRGVIHVGAHRGEEIDIYTKMGVQRVIWLEPNPDVFKELQYNLSTTTTTITSYIAKLAACNKDDEDVDLHICYAGDAGFMVGNKGCSSLLEPIGNMASWYQQTVKVKTVTLDTFFKRYNLNISDFELLYMDVQGAELSVLQGASQILKNVKYISTEFSLKNPDYKNNVMFDELKQYIEGYGFNLIETALLSEKEGDALFRKELV